jgi:hypothetical protein
MTTCHPEGSRPRTAPRCPTPYALSKDHLWMTLGDSLGAQPQVVRADRESFLGCGKPLPPKGALSSHRTHFAACCRSDFKFRGYASRTSAGLPALNSPLLERVNAVILTAICSVLCILARANRSGLSASCWRCGQFNCAGTVGWARTTDLLFHRQAL